MTQTNTDALILKGVSVGALSGVELTIAPGEVVCLSGESGSGKSRLLRAVADLEPHEGEVFLGATNRDTLTAHEWRQKVMLVPAESQWWADTVGEHFCHPVPEALHALGFDERALDWSVARLSSGEKQRLAAARAWSCRPTALLLDEPTANLDDENTQRFEQWMSGLIEQTQSPVLWVAHDEAQIRRVGQRHYRIQDDHLERVR